MAAPTRIDESRRVQCAGLMIVYTLGSKCQVGLASGFILIIDGTISIKG